MTVEDRPAQKSRAGEFCAVITVVGKKVRCAKREKKMEVFGYVRVRGKKMTRITKGRQEEKQTKPKGSSF